MPPTRGQQKCQKVPLEELSYISIRNASPFDITCTIEGQFRIAFPANGEVPEIVGERPDGVYLQGVQSKMRRVRHGKVDKSQGHSSFYVLARECLFFSRSGLGEGRVVLHEGHLEQRNRVKLTPQAQLDKDSGDAPDTAVRPRLLRRSSRARRNAHEGPIPYDGILWGSSALWSEDNKGHAAPQGEGKTENGCIYNNTEAGLAVTLNAPK
ncbi:hypothetical protein LTR56_027519 [Elasticomyces elasticus]|nr:hypothetical protein LTR56_027519 [Elasticomyces elasticus]KAK3616312.1 hypothetical protein LTR22_027116 [Elasticomyces elasticus]KAK4898569.1 hypothetical protein LTR49_027783 [Elasticomyces elasticus]KAK5734953.1 hypothetical protein LTS12_026590 [Elasticomyces elasticus]